MFKASSTISWAIIKMDEPPPHVCPRLHFDEKNVFQSGKFLKTLLVSVFEHTSSKYRKSLFIFFQHLSHFVPDPVTIKLSVLNWFISVGKL